MSDFAKLATAIASSKAAMEVFNRVVASSQTIGDAYARTMSVAKTVTDDFVYSIANADFTRFTDGLKGVRQRAQEAYDALDQLGNTQISYKYFSAEERALFAQGITTAKDTTLSMEERRAGLAASEASLARLKKMTESLSTGTEDYLRKEIAKIAGLNASDVETDALAKALAVDVSGNAAQIRQGIIDRYNEYQRRYANEVAPYASEYGANAYGYTVRNWKYDPDKAAAAAAALNAEYAETKANYGLIIRISDEELDKLAQKKIAVNDTNRSMQELVRQYQEAARALNQPIKSGTVGAALTGEQLAEFYSPNVNSIFTNDFGRKRAAALNPYYEEGKSYGAVKYNLPIIDVPIISDDIIEESLSDAPVVLDKITESSYTAVDGINAISGAMSNLSGAVGEGAGAWLDWGANVLSSIAAAIPAITALTAAKEAEATANTAAAASGAASSVASIPYVGAIMAVGAIASVIAALAKLPKFATGGVVPGNALSGDNVLIRANSGEVVLTKQQANNIGSALAGFGGNVRFVIEGDKLVGVLNNHNSITSRSYGH